MPANPALFLVCVATDHHSLEQLKVREGGQELDNVHVRLHLLLLGCAVSKFHVVVHAPHQLPHCFFRHSAGELGIDQRLVLVVDLCPFELVLPVMVVGVKLDTVYAKKILTFPDERLGPDHRVEGSERVEVLL